MIHRVQKCFGITLWKWKRHIELWVCFSGVDPHWHPRQSFEVIPIFGWSMFTRLTPERRVQTIAIKPRNWLRAVSVPAGWVHWFKTKFLVVVTVSNRTVSAADNILYTDIGT